MKNRIPILIALMFLLWLGLTVAVAADVGPTRTLAGHTGSVDSVTFSPDGSVLASGSYDKSIKLWDVATGEEIRTLTGHMYAIYSVTFSPDGRTLASASYDKTIKLWNVRTGELTHTLVGHTYPVLFRCL